MNDLQADPRWAQLGRWLKLQRDAAMTSRREIASLGGPSISTQQALEDGGRRYRGEWIVPSPDAKTWGRLAAAVGFDLEELRYEGVKADLWEEDEFPMEEAARHWRALDSDLWFRGVGPHVSRIRAPDEPPIRPEDELLSAVRNLTAAVNQLRADLREGRP